MPDMSQSNLIQTDRSSSKRNRSARPSSMKCITTRTARGVHRSPEDQPNSAAGAGRRHPGDRRGAGIPAISDVEGVATSIVRYSASQGRRHHPRSRLHGSFISAATSRWSARSRSNSVSVSARLPPTETLHPAPGLLPGNCDKAPALMIDDLPPMATCARRCRQTAEAYV